MYVTPLWMSTSIASSVADLADPDLTRDLGGELMRAGEEDAATVDDEGVIILIRPGRAGTLNSTCMSSEGACPSDDECGGVSMTR